MRLWIFLSIALAYRLSNAQGITASEQTALNQYITCANYLTEALAPLTPSLSDVYQHIERYPKNQQPFRYLCAINVDESYINRLLGADAGLSANQKSIREQVQELVTVFQSIDQQCKQLEVYIRLEDYKRDNFQQFFELVSGIIKSSKTYQTTLFTLQAACEKAADKLHPVSNVYQQTYLAMLRQLEIERSVLNSFSFNINEKIFSGWNPENLSLHIVQNDAAIQKIKQVKPGLAYPASTMLPSFIEGLDMMQQTKRLGVDEFTLARKTSDNHTNQLYRDLINYYNGVLVADVNTFVKFSNQNGFKGLYSFLYPMLPGIKEKEISVSVSINPFQDKPRVPIAIVPVASPISKNEFKALSNYVEFINEGVRQLNNLMQTMRNLNNSAVYSLQTIREGRKSTVSFYNNNFQVPQTLFDQTLEESKNLGSYSQPLNEQTRVLHSILREVSDWTQWAYLQSNNKTLHEDSLKRVFNFLDRFETLLYAFDEKKELLAHDVSSIFESYLPYDKSSSWYVSSVAMRDAVREDHQQLFAARRFYREQVAFQVAPQKIDSIYRNLVANEYSNLKGIQKLGRSHGLCPYSPYEDVAEYSKTFRNKLIELPQRKADNPNRHPYNDLIYTYNHVVDEFNRFATLSPIMILKDIKQPEYFRVQRALPKAPTAGTASVALQQPEPVKSMAGFAYNNLILLLDISGSMVSPQKLPLLKQAVIQLLDIMRPEDQVSIVTFSTKGKVLLEATSFADRDKIKDAIEKLVPLGKTDGNTGIKMAYQQAIKNRKEAGNNRIILATDGEFPVSENSLKLIEESTGQDIQLSVFDLGATEAGSKSLEKLSAIGKGFFKRITPENVDSALLIELQAKKLKP